MMRPPLLALLLLSVLFIRIKGSDGLPVNSENANRSAKQKARRLIDLPKDLDVSKMPLKDLVDMKPEKYNSAKGYLYQKYFAQHPDVQKINLHDSEPVRPAQALIALRSNHPKDWQLKLTASIKNHIDGAPFETEEDRKKLVEIVKGRRHQTVKETKHQRYQEKTGKEGIKEKRLAIESRYREKTGFSYRTRIKRLQREMPMLNQPLSTHLDEGGKSLTALEVEEQVRHLGHLYSNPGVLTRELDRYLKSKKTPEEERLAAMAMRAGRMYENAQERHRKKMKTSDNLPSSSSPALQRMQAVHSASTSRRSRVINSQNQIGQASTSLQHPSTPPHEQPSPNLVDPNNKKDWDLLRDFLKN